MKNKNRYCEKIISYGNILLVVEDKKEDLIFVMLTASRAKVYENNQTYAVNIPQELNFQAEEVYMNKIGDVIMMTPISRLAETLERGAAILASYSEDFMKNGLPEEIPAFREEL